MPLSAWLGALFDAAAFQRRHRGRVADHVIMWAAYWIKMLARSHQAAVQQEAAGS
jgi:hypothetical protein